MKPTPLAAQAEAYRGQLNAEPVYEWVKRAAPDSPRGMSSLQPTEAALRHFLSPTWRQVAQRRAASVEESSRGRLPPKAVLFSSRPVADSLFARHMASALRERLTLSAMHVAGGIDAASEAAALVRSLGLTELPAIALWRDAEEPMGTAPPTLLRVGANPDAAARAAVIDELRRAAAPSVPLLTPANYHQACAPLVWDDDARFCVILVVPIRQAGAAWPPPAVAALRTLRALARSLAGTEDGAV